MLCSCKCQHQTFRCCMFCSPVSVFSPVFLFSFSLFLFLTFSFRENPGIPQFVLQKPDGCISLCRIRHDTSLYNLPYISVGFTKCLLSPSAGNHVCHACTNPIQIRPLIQIFPVILFRCGKSGCSLKISLFCYFICICCIAEINQMQSAVMYDNVFWLDIQMQNRIRLHGMKIYYNLCQLPAVEYSIMQVKRTI